MLCSSHRDHKSFDRCPRRHPKPRLQEPQRRLPRPGKRGQEVTPRLGGSGRPLRDPGAPTIPTASLRLWSRRPSVDHMYQLIFKGPPADKQITLIKVGDHYHGCNSLPGFLGKHFYCVECETGYEHDTINQHPCKGKKCRACCQTQCQDYLQHGNEAAKQTCPRCHRKFFGENCMGNHNAYSETDGVKANYDKKIKNVCSTARKCPECNRLLRDYEIETKKYVCGTSECPSCRQYKDLTTHQCYIQDPSKLEEKRKLLRSRKRRADGSQVRIEKDPLFVYWDSETMQDTGGSRAQLGVRCHVQHRHAVSL